MPSSVMLLGDWAEDEFLRACHAGDLSTGATIPTSSPAARRACASKSTASLRSRSPRPCACGPGAHPPRRGARARRGRWAGLVPLPRAPAGPGGGRRPWRGSVIPVAAAGRCRIGRGRALPRHVRRVHEGRALRRPPSARARVVRPQPGPRARHALRTDPFRGCPRRGEAAWRGERCLAARATRPAPYPRPSLARRSRTWRWAAASPGCWRVRGSPPGTGAT